MSLKHKAIFLIRIHNMKNFKVYFILLIVFFLCLFHNFICDKLWVCNVCKPVVKYYLDLFLIRLPINTTKCAIFKVRLIYPFKKWIYDLKTTKYAVTKTGHDGMNGMNVSDYFHFYGQKNITPSMIRESPCNS